MEDGKNSGDIGTMLQGALGDPRFAQILTTLKEKSDSGELDTEKLLGSLLSGNGDALAALTGKKENAEEHGDGAVGGEHGGKKKSAPRLDDHKRLLAALKPYLSDNKKEAVESLLKIGSIGEIAEKLGGLGGRS